MAFLFKSGDSDRKNQTETLLLDALGMLADIQTRLAALQERIDTVERTLAERLPPDILTERKFAQEVQGSDDIVGQIISKVEELSKAKSVRDILESRVVEQKPSPVEAKRMEVITGLLQQHGKISSDDLANLMGLSRTRCNEYFKRMEEIGIVEPVLVGKEKFYRLS
jgi:biotin operon repressor